MTHFLSLITHPKTPVLTNNTLKRLDGLISSSSLRILNPDIAVEYHVGEDLPLEQARNLFADIPVDLNLVPATSRTKKLLIADMDSTIIEQECIDELAAHIGKFDEIAEITERAMRGELDFESALINRVRMLAGLPESVIDETWRNRITFTSGAKSLVATMKQNGAISALVSGGFTPFTGKVASAVGFDLHKANTLIINEGCLTGEVARPILGREAKADTLKSLCVEYKIDLSETMAVGDGANDLDMLGLAGMGVAFHAKPATATAAQYQINHGDLTALLYLQGLPHTAHASITD